MIWDILCLGYNSTTSPFLDILVHVAQATMCPILSFGVALSQVTGTGDDRLAIRREIVGLFPLSSQRYERCIAASP